MKAVQYYIFQIKFDPKIPTRISSSWWWWLWHAICLAGFVLSVNRHRKMVMRTALSVTFGFNLPFLNTLFLSRKAIPESCSAEFRYSYANPEGNCLFHLSRAVKTGQTSRSSQRKGKPPLKAEFRKIYFSTKFLPQRRVWRVELSRMSPKNSASATLVVWTCWDGLLAERNMA